VVRHAYFFWNFGLYVGFIRETAQNIFGVIHWNAKKKQVAQKNQKADYSKNKQKYLHHF
jgi:hypothetical protein